MARQVHYCKVTDCDIKCHGGGYCLMHYKRVRKHGSVDKQPVWSKNRKCDVDGCDNKHDSLGYCIRHLRQFEKHGHILTADEIYKHRSECKTGKTHIGALWTDEAKKLQSVKMQGKTLNTGRTHFKKGDERLIGNKNCLGRTPWNKGKKLSLEHIEKLRKSRIGAVPWNKGTGLTTYTEDRLARIKFRVEMQKKVLLRDNFTCQVCQQYAGNLQVDHIKSWKKYPELRFEIDNCRTLCMACHYYVTFKRKMPEGIVWGHNLNRRIAS